MLSYICQHQLDLFQPKSTLGSLRYHRTYKKSFRNLTISKLRLLNVKNWSWKLQMQLLRTLAELLRITAHRRTPRLPPVVMVAPFVSFIVVYSNSYCCGKWGVHVVC